MTRSVLRTVVRLVLAFVPFVPGLPTEPAFGAQGLTFPPNGDNPQAAVMQAIGPVRVKIEYSSPRVVRGSNDRRGSNVHRAAASCS